jgi:hypothetical protein
MKSSVTVASVSDSACASPSAATDHPCCQQSSRHDGAPYGRHFVSTSRLLNLRVFAINEIVAGSRGNRHPRALSESLDVA